MSQEYNPAPVAGQQPNEYAYNYEPAYTAARLPAPAQQPSAVGSWFNFQDSSYAKGLVVGAGIALVLANPAVQKAVVAGAVKLWSGIQGGVEEVKEHIQDIRAEMSKKE